VFKALGRIPSALYQETNRFAVPWPGTLARTFPKRGAQGDWVSCKEEASLAGIELILRSRNRGRSPRLIVQGQDTVSMSDTLQFCIRNCQMNGVDMRKARG
jgi:hypothetical protein